MDLKLPLHPSPREPRNCRLPVKRPHIYISHIMDRFRPARLNYRISIIVPWKKVAKFDQKGFGALMRELARQSKRLEEKSSSAQRNSYEESVFSENGEKLQRKKRKKQSTKRKRQKKRIGIELKRKFPKGCPKGSL